MTKRKAKGGRAPQKGPSPWIPWLAAGGLALVAVLGAGIFLSSQEPAREKSPVPNVSGGPGLFLGHAAFDFGRVPFDLEKRHTFVIQNIGDAPLVLERRPEVRLLEGC